MIDSCHEIEKKIQLLIAASKLLFESNLFKMYELLDTAGNRTVEMVRLQNDGGRKQQMFPNSSDRATMIRR